MGNIYQKFNQDPALNITVKYRYQGKEITAKYLSENSDIFQKFPAQKMFDQAYNKLKLRNDPKIPYILEVSESGCKSYPA